MVLAHVEGAAVHGGAAQQVLRLGPLLALLLVATWAVVARAGTAAPPSRRRRLAAGAAVALGSAGAIHLALIGQHTRESLASGVFFAAAGVTELLLAVALWRTPGSRRTALAAVVVAGGLLLVYASSRLWSIPAFGGREAIDTLGLLTKLLELTGAVLAVAAMGSWSRWSLRPIRPRLLVAAAAVAVALAAHRVFQLGAEPWQVAIVVVVTVGIGVAFGSRDREQLAAAAADGAVLALLLRAGGVGPYLLAGVAAGLLGMAAHRWSRWVLAPVATAALLGPGGAAPGCSHGDPARQPLG